MRRKKILVTGATGFVGKNLIPLLLKKYSVRIVTRNNRTPYGKRVDFHKADLKTSLPEVVIKGVDAIIHLASEVGINQSIQNPRERFEHNLSMTLSVLEAVRKSNNRPLIVFASTDRLYGKTTKALVTEKEPAFPIEPYTASKILSETALATYAHLYDIPYIILRFDSIYGPHQPKEMFISDIIQKMMTENNITTGSLHVRKNFVYIEDVVRALISTLESKSKAHNQAYNIGGPSVSLSKVLGVTKNIMSTKLNKKITTSEDKVVRRPSKAEVRPFALSVKKARQLLKWYPKTSLKQGLEKTVDYFIYRTKNA